MLRDGWTQAACAVLIWVNFLWTDEHVGNRWAMGIAGETSIIEVPLRCLKSEPLFGPILANVLISESTPWSARA